jgi:hypothetical protein
MRIDSADVPLLTAMVVSVVELCSRVYVRNESRQEVGRGGKVRAIVLMDVGFACDNTSIRRLDSLHHHNINLLLTCKGFVLVFTQSKEIFFQLHLVTKRSKGKAFSSL